MLSSLAKTLLTCTAMAPVALVYAWLALFKDEYLLTAVLFVATIMLVLTCHALLKFSGKYIPSAPFNISSIESADSESTVFLLVYILPLFTANFETLNWIILIPTFIFITTLAATGYSYQFNPLLRLVGWHFYKVGTPEGVSYILITRKEIRNARNVLSAAQLTEYLMIDLKKE